MGFRENLKKELGYSGMLVKELVEKSGVSKYTLDKYLREDCSSPSAEAAVRIAGALGVSVEYLITGSDSRCPKLLQSPAARQIAEILDSLEEEDRKMALMLVRYFKRRLAACS